MSHGWLQLGVLALSLALRTACGFADEVDPALRGDAQLTDVAFVDAEHGWAVGDRGTIWRTEDGGAHWSLQHSNVDCRLSTVCFLDRKTGWAAGGWTQPYTHVATGVILRTRDGGEHWTADRNSMLPAVRSIKFFGTANGVAVGQQSALFPAGVFTTDDGGRSWSSLPPASEQSWLAGDFADALTGVVVGRSGAIGAIRRKAIEHAHGADFGLRALHQVKVASSNNAWLVGDGGLVMQSDDGGLSWQMPPSDIPAPLRAQIDFHAIALHGDNLWIAGSPGTRILHSVNRGRTWLAHSTGQTMPIRALTFLDAEHGWAVGDLGMILVTRDGGQTWRFQHVGGSRAALMGIFSEPRDVPLDLFAKLSGDDGYLGVVELLNRTDVETPTLHAAETPSRVHEALLHTGACVAETAWRFPSRQSGLALSAEQLLEAWNRANDGRALERLDEYLVKQLRLWRPNVVVTPMGGSERNDGRAQLINQIVLRSIEHAADPQQYPEQIADVGLAPWKVTKVYCSLAPGENGSTNITSAQTTRSGRSVADLASPARGLIDRAYKPSPASLGFRLIVDHVPQEVGAKDFFSGIPLSPGGEARRPLRESMEQTVEALRRSGQARRNLNAILARVDDRRDQGRYLAEVTELVRTMDNGHAAEVLLQLANRYHDRGQWELAADTSDAIVERYPKHPAAGAALVWLVQYYASGEAAWRVSQRQQFVSVEDSGSSTIEQDTELHAPKRNVQRANAVVALPNGQVDRPSRASGYAKQLEQLNPALFAEPTVRFPLAAANRAQGYSRHAERFFLGFVRNRPHDVWWASAQTELAMLSRERETIEQASGVGGPGAAQNESSGAMRYKALCRCRRVQGKPRLDGKLNDPIWQGIEPIELKSRLRDDGEWPAIAMLVHDNEFLYLAISCHQAPGVTYAPSQVPRPRDGELTSNDRVELYLDLDRDFATAYRLVVDARGWTNDSCWGDATWNPQWFVASAQGNDQKTGPTWTVEAAIPFSELTRLAPQPNQTWAVGVQRIVPNVGFQSWNQPAAIEAQPEGFGLLIFE